MQRHRRAVVASAHVAVAVLATCIFGARFVDCLPFSGNTRAFNPETVSTLLSFFIFAGEPWTFPLGRIDRLTFPFFDANIGNVGALPLVALAVKLLGSVWAYFLTFDYFVLVELLSSFLTAMFVQHALGILGVRRFPVRAVGGFLAGTSFILFTRSEWLQPFCVVSFPIFAAWIVMMVAALQGRSWGIGKDVLVVALFPAAALLDNYTLFAIMLGTAVIAAWEVATWALSGHRPTGLRGVRFSVYVFAGVSSSLLALWTIGMYPLPPVPQDFTSYDFGVGGRFHGANVLSLVMPVARGETGAYPQSSLLVRAGFPFTTERFGKGQYEGIAFIGTPLLVAFAGFAVHALWRRIRPSDPFKGLVPSPSLRPLLSPWGKVAIATAAVFVFSLGYELSVGGRTYPKFGGMPAAWLSDRIPAIYNIRATGRLATLASIVLLIEAFRRLDQLLANTGLRGRPAPGNHGALYLALGLVISVHFVEIVPFLKPFPTQRAAPGGNGWTEAQAAQLRELARGHGVLMIAPSAWAAETSWTARAFEVGYHSGLRSNLYYIARTHPDHDRKIARDLALITEGSWSQLEAEYGVPILFAVSEPLAKALRERVTSAYTETSIAGVSIWRRRD